MKGPTSLIACSSRGSRARARGRGSKTRTWFGVKDQPIFAWAGLRRQSAEWGDVYSGVMTNCNEAIRPVYDRIPVLLEPHEYNQWLQGTLDDALAFQNQCFPDELIVMERTTELWTKRSPAFTSRLILTDQR